MVLPLCLEPHPVLRSKACRVEMFTHEIRRLARDLTDTMYAHDGIGLAAPQVGLDLQVFVANPTQQRGREVVVVNPVLGECRGRMAITEGCLSVPNVWERVRRASDVRLKGQDVFGKPIAIDAEGLLAIVLQHEFDHLQGQLFIDRLSWFRRARVAAQRRRTAQKHGDPNYQTPNPTQAPITRALLQAQAFRPGRFTVW